MAQNQNLNTQGPNTMDMNMQQMNTSMVPGTTAGPLSPGSIKYSAQHPAPAFFGSNIPAQQMPGGFNAQQTTVDSSQYVTAPGSPTPKGIEYTQGYLRTLIGQNVRVEFELGTNMLQDRRGLLLGVGIDYILLREPQTDDVLYCDIYSITFVTVYK